MSNLAGPSALREDFQTALLRIHGARGRRDLWQALRELNLDGDSTLAIAARLEDLEREAEIEAH